MSFVMVSALYVFSFSLSPSRALMQASNSARTSLWRVVGSGGGFDTRSPGCKYFWIFSELVKRALKSCRLPRCVTGRLETFGRHFVEVACRESALAREQGNAGAARCRVTGAETALASEVLSRKLLKRRQLSILFWGTAFVVKAGGSHASQMGRWLLPRPDRDVC